jgi:hypothetical protein
MHHIIVDGLHVWCGDQWLKDFDQAMKQYYKENMTKRKNKPTGIEAMAGDGFKPSDPTESNVKNMFEELVKDNQTPEDHFVSESINETLSEYPVWIETTPPIPGCTVGELTKEEFPTTGFKSIELMQDKTWIAEESPKIESFTYHGSNGDIDVKWIKNPVLDQTETMKAGIAQAEVNNESTPYTRLIEEEKELRQKVEKLQKFLRDPFKAKLTINEEHFNLLIKQYGYMGSYLEILTKRIQLFN